MSPGNTDLACANSPAPRRIPVVPDFVALFTRKAPPTVAVAFKVKTAFDTELSTLPAAIVPVVNDGRVALDYGTNSAHPE